MEDAGHTSYFSRVGPMPTAGHFLYFYRQGFQPGIWMSDSLFRREVVAAQRGEWLGTIRLQPPRFGWTFLALGACVLAVVLAVALLGQFMRRATSEGVLVASSGITTVSAAAPGIATRIVAHDGDMVRAGQPLVEISSETTSASLGDTHAEIARQLQMKRDRLDEEVSDGQHLEEVKQRDLISRQTLLQAQITQMKGQIDIQQQRADSAMSLYQQWMQLSHSGIVTRLQLLQQHDTALQNMADVRELAGRDLQLKQDAAQLAAQLAALPAESSARLGELRRQIADVAQAQAENAAKGTVVLRAAVTGRVGNLVVHEGQPVAAGEPLLSILPSDAKLIAELWVPGEAIAFVAAGQRVSIRYEAFPYQRYGQQTGRVSDVARSAMPTSEINRLLGHAVAEPRYRVRVALDAQHVNNAGAPEPLRPGMTLNADIVTGKRHLVDWLTEPLTAGSAVANVEHSKAEEAD